MQTLGFKQSQSLSLSFFLSLSFPYAKMNLELLFVQTEKCWHLCSFIATDKSALRHVAFDLANSGGMRPG